MEKIKKILHSQTLRDTIIIFVGLGITTIAGFLYTVVLAGILGPEQFGVFSSLSALVAIVFSLGDLGVAPAMINFLPKLSKKRLTLISTGFWFQLAVGFLIIGLFFVFAYFRNLIIPGSFFEHLLLAGLLSFNYLLISFAQSIFTADRHFLRLSASQIIDAVIKIVLVYILVWASKVSISTALFANVLSTAIALIFTFGKYLFTIRPNFDRQVSYDIFHFSKWITVSRFFSVFITRIDILLLNILSSSYHAGIFAAANRITILFALVVSSLGSVVNPRFSGFTHANQVLSYLKKLSLLVLVLCFGMLGTTLFASPIINIVFGKQYSEAILVFQLLIVAMIPFTFLSIINSALLYTYNQAAFYAKITAFQVISIILIDVAFIPILGLYAPVLALGITNLLVLVISSFKLRSLLNIVVSN